MPKKKKQSKKKTTKNDPYKDCYKYTICVSGSAVGEVCAPDAAKKAEALGREIVKNNCVLVTGATTGIPLHAAKGAKQAGGISIGLSPAFSERDHLRRYKLPVDYQDLIIYTGFEYAGRNLLLTRASDAVIIACGRIGTLNEFTIAFEDDKPIGVLTGTGVMADMVRGIIDQAHRGKGKIVYDSDPAKLVKKLLVLIRKESGLKALPNREPHK
jgi:uncharacterized protein (TIGR00725 family)